MNTGWGKCVLITLSNLLIIPHLVHNPFLRFHVPKYQPSTISYLLYLSENFKAIHHTPTNQYLLHNINQGLIHHFEHWILYLPVIRRVIGTCVSSKSSNHSLVPPPPHLLSLFTAHLLRVLSSLHPILSRNGSTTTFEIYFFSLILSIEMN